MEHYTKHETLDGTLENLRAMAPETGTPLPLIPGFHSSRIKVHEQWPTCRVTVCDNGDFFMGAAQWTK